MRGVWLGARVSKGFGLWDVRLGATDDTGIYYGIWGLVLQGLQCKSLGWVPAAAS